MITIIKYLKLESLIPSMFGAEVYKSAGGYVDVKPIINDIEQAEDLEVCNGQFDMALEHIKYLKKNAPEGHWVAVTTVCGGILETCRKSLYPASSEGYAKQQIHFIAGAFN